MDKLEVAINNSPLVRAAIVEAVHRFYHDRILSERKEDKKDLEETGAEECLKRLWHLVPNWRHILHTIPQRYKSHDTDSVAIPITKPNSIPLIIEITIE